MAAGLTDEAQPVLAQALALAPDDPRVLSRSAAP
jgi:hypothetical protein